MAKSKSTPLIVGSFVAMALLLGGAYYIGDNQSDKAYICESTKQVGLCDKLSSGLGTRCYYTIDGVQKYKTCATGWIKYTAKTENLISAHSYLCDTEKCVPK